MRREVLIMENINRDLVYRKTTRRKEMNVLLDDFKKEGVPNTTGKEEAKATSFSKIKPENDKGAYKHNLDKRKGGEGGKQIMIKGTTSQGHVKMKKKPEKGGY